jgi:hypothetical protein
MCILLRGLVPFSFVVVTCSVASSSYQRLFCSSSSRCETFKFQGARAVVVHYSTRKFMADDEDDYLSDKFLIESAPSQPKTYAERRKQAQKQAQLKNEANRLKSRRERELESREEGLSKSLFERAKEEEASGINTGNKALSMMMKMGFRPGQALGKQEDDRPLTITPELNHDHLDEQLETTADISEPGLSGTSQSVSKHKTEPLPINEWMGMYPLLWLHFCYAYPPQARKV